VLASTKPEVDDVEARTTPGPSAVAFVKPKRQCVPIGGSGLAWVGRKFPWLRSWTVGCGWGRVAVFAPPARAFEPGRVFVVRIRRRFAGLASVLVAGGILFGGT
jgi:hypothetical protein